MYAIILQPEKNGRLAGNRSEMRKEMRLLEKSLGKSVFHTRGIARIVNLTVLAAYAESQSCLQDLRIVVQQIRTSVKRRERFEE